MEGEEQVKYTQTLLSHLGYVVKNGSISDAGEHLRRLLDGIGAQIGTFEREKVELFFDSFNRAEGFMGDMVKASTILTVYRCSEIILGLMTSAKSENLGEHLNANHTFIFLCTSLESIFESCTKLEQSVQRTSDTHSEKHIFITSFENKLGEWAKIVGDKGTQKRRIHKSVQQLMTSMDGRSKGKRPKTRKCAHLFSYLYYMWDHAQAVIQILVTGWPSGLSRSSSSSSISSPPSYYTNVRGQLIKTVVHKQPPPALDFWRKLGLEEPVVLKTWEGPGPAPGGREGSVASSESNNLCPEHARLVSIEEGDNRFTASDEYGGDYDDPYGGEEKQRRETEETHVTSLETTIATISPGGDGEYDLNLTGSTSLGGLLSSGTETEDYQRNIKEELHSELREETDKLYQKLAKMVFAKVNKLSGRMGRLEKEMATDRVELENVKLETRKTRSEVQEIRQIVAEMKTDFHLILEAMNYTASVKNFAPVDVITDDHVRIAAELIGQAGKKLYKEFFLNLGVPLLVIQDIEGVFRGGKQPRHEDVIQELLKNWRMRKMGKASLNDIVAVLVEMKQSDLARQLLTQIKHGDNK